METRSRFRRLRSPPKWGRARRGECRGDPGIQASSRQAKRRRIALPPRGDQAKQLAMTPDIKKEDLGPLRSARG
jgi:hypothetical protein